MTHAERIARHAHAGQLERHGHKLPYTAHLERVVALVSGEDAQAVAWLHDTLEDTRLTSGDLAVAGIAPEVIDAVVILTQDDYETYADYIERVAAEGPGLARRVKVADLLDHLRADTLGTLPQSLVHRYVWALERLTR